jgi:prolyl-tRNA synthetase
MRTANSPTPGPRAWGVSTRLIGGLIMSHSDDDGLILPPRLAPVHVVIMPITFKADDPDAVMNYCAKLADDLRVLSYQGRSVDVEIDDRDLRGGDKVWSWVKKGVPIRLEIGPRDMQNDAVFMARRDKSHKDKQSMPRAEFVESCTQILDDIQDALFKRAVDHRQAHMKTIDTEAAFRDFFTAPQVDENQPTPIHGGFALSHWSGDPEVEAKINDELSVTVRCIPQEDLGDGPGTCPFTGQPSRQRVVWAKSY